MCEFRRQAGDTDDSSPRPLVYYTRFGFERLPSNASASEPAEFFMVKLIGHEQPSGAISFHGAFYDATE